jgi:hypothetical protein
VVSSTVPGFSVDAFSVAAGPEDGVPHAANTARDNTISTSDKTADPNLFFIELHPSISL